MFSSGAANAHTLTAVAGLAVILSAAYTLWMVQKLVFGETNARTASFRDLNTTELISLSFILLLILALGIYPNAILAWVPTAG
jgi:NADH-quinone oxidoreductase subunit M